MAKVGNVSPTGGSSDSIKSAVMGDLTPNLTLGQVAAAALSATDEDLVIVIDLSARTLKVKPAADAAILKDGSEGHHTRFEIDDATKKVAPWSGSGWDAADVANVTAKPSRSLAALISAIEDFLAISPDLGQPKIVIDQVNEEVRLFDQADVFTEAPSASLAEFEAPVATVSGTPRGPFE